MQKLLLHGGHATCLQASDDLQQVGHQSMPDRYRHRRMPIVPVKALKLSCSLHGLQQAPAKHEPQPAAALGNQSLE